MKRLVAVLASSLLLLSGCGNTSSTNLNATDFQRKSVEPNVVVLDVRTAGEFAMGHIAHAINIDVESMTFDGDIKGLDKSKTYAVYCHSGRRSGIAVEKMKSAGFKDLFNLTNGIQEWQAAGLPLVNN
jgi:rhodanese-related sulfurtransferase